MNITSQIAELSRKLGYGNYASDGIKAILGKNPVNLSEGRSQEVLAALQKRYAASPAGQEERAEAEELGWIEDAPMHHAYTIRARR